jgi:hypothetical protein
MKNKNEFLTLFNYLGKPAGSELGQKIFETAKKQKEKIQILHLPFKYEVEGEKKRKVMMYKKEFLDKILPTS